jgi:hypothetical protein
LVVLKEHKRVAQPPAKTKGGDPSVVGIDLSPQGTFSSASWPTMDKKTELAHAPTVAPVCPADHLTIQLGGYGMAFLKLIPLGFGMWLESRKATIGVFEMAMLGVK